MILKFFGGVEGVTNQRKIVYRSMIDSQELQLSRFRFFRNPEYNNVVSIGKGDDHEVEKENWDSDEEDSDDPVQQPAFDELYKWINSSLDNLGGYVVPKLNSVSPIVST